MPDVNAPDKVLSAKDIPNPSEMIEKLMSEEEVAKMIAERRKQLEDHAMSEDKGKYEFDRAAPEKLRSSVDLDAVEGKAVNALITMIEKPFASRDRYDAAVALLNHVRESSK